MTHKSPGKSDRKGITMMQLCDMFPGGKRTGMVRGPRLARRAVLPTCGSSERTKPATITCPIGRRIAGHISRKDRNGDAKVAYPPP